MSNAINRSSPPGMWIHRHFPSRLAVVECEYFANEKENSPGVNEFIIIKYTGEVVM
jgi:hypothetical protein